MQVIETYSKSRATHPATLKTCRAIVFKFSTGHTMTKYEGGLEFFTNKAGNAMNYRTGTKLIEQMRRLVA